MQTWKPMVYHNEKYTISNHGEIKRGTKILIPKLEPNGYYRIGIMINGKQRHFLISRLVAQYFLPNGNINIINGLTVDHIDRNRSNNNISNLRFATMQQQNANRKKRWATNAYEGVTWNKRNKCFRVQIRHNSKMLHSKFGSNPLYLHVFYYREWHKELYGTHSKYWDVKYKPHIVRLTNTSCTDI